LHLQTVAVIGAGPAGRAFALRCVTACLDVILEDVMPSNLRRAQDEYSDLARSSSTGFLRYALTVEDAVRVADIAIDFVPDELESKLEIFSMLDRMAPPRTLLCTPTRTLSITDLASCTYRPNLCIALRSATQNTLESPLEIIRSRFADPTTLTAVAELLNRLGIASQIADDLAEPMLLKNLASNLTTTH
jgi:3-hydroxybutyryl-CoA dehydrogenase